MSGRIHIGKRDLSCPQLKVHGKKMKNSDKEKYLGDQITKLGNLKATIEGRVAKGYGIVSEIKTLLDEIPLGIYRVEMGLKLRQAMLINGLLYNSEAWHSVSKDDIKQLEKIDEVLLRSLLGSHQKTPLEFLYLETGSLPITYILSIRRMMYLKVVMMREDEELTKRILKEQEKSPSPGDFIEHVKEDFDKIGLTFSESFITQTAIKTYKNIIKRHTRIKAFSDLVKTQKSHSKVQKIEYSSFKCQEYLSSGMFKNEEISILSSLRSHTVRTVRYNFKNLYKNNLNCPLKCWEDGNEPNCDTQEHILSCKRISERVPLNPTVARNKVKYDDIYGNLHEQKEVISVFKQRIQTRNEMIEQQLTSEPITLDPSILLCSVNT